VNAIRKTRLPFLAVLFLAAILPSGCAAPEIKATETHRKGLEPLTEDGYFAPPKPVDRTYIGYAWSRQFGPVEDASSPDIRVKKERSLNNVLQERAYNRGISLGGEYTPGVSATIGAQSGGDAQSKLSGLEIISAVSLADIPFEPNVPYITEALRLANFRIRQEKGTKVGVGAGSKGSSGAGIFSAETGGVGRSASDTLSAALSPGTDSAMCRQSIMSRERMKIANPIPKWLTVYVFRPPDGPLVGGVRGNGFGNPEEMDVSWHAIVSR
jgi:hypothetical protein